MIAQVVHLTFLCWGNLPLDVIVGWPEAQSHEYECSTEYVEWLRKTMHNVHSFAQKQLNDAAKRQKTQYDKHCKPMKYSEGQYVWRYYPPTAKQKLGRGWVGPYRILSCPTSIHCNISLSPSSKAVRVHIDHLKPHLGKVPQEWLDYESSEQEDSDLSDDYLSDDSGSKSSNSSSCESEDTPSENDEDNTAPDQGTAQDNQNLPLYLPRRSHRERKPVDRMDL